MKFIAKLPPNSSYGSYAKPAGYPGQQPIQNNMYPMATNSYMPAQVPITKPYQNSYL